MWKMEEDEPLGPTSFSASNEPLPAMLLISLDLSHKFLSLINFSPELASSMERHAKFN